MKYTKLSMLFITTLLTFSSCSQINTNNDSHFTEEGYLINDSTQTVLKEEQPSLIKFFIEVSGSMNGFFRANLPTYFKSDVWQILSYYQPIAPYVTILTNSGSSGATINMVSFQQQMNTGAFISQASTKVPVMLETILSNLDTEKGEVAVLISDMKYSPVGSAAPQVLLTQYSTDVSTIIGKYNKAVSLICATSNYLNKNGVDVTTRSPYYYLILGSPAQVVNVRNGLSTLLKDRGHFIDNIESGINYGKQSYSFGMSILCEQLDDEPTFIGYEEPDEAFGDTCTINLKIDLTKYRWILEDELVLRNSIKVETTYGSNVKVGKISYNITTKKDKELKRDAFANVELKVFNMATDSEVLKWGITIPDTDYTLFYEFFDGAYDENDVTKSYSVADFIKGMFYGGVINTQPSTNYILISKND